jgi:hypothetical protein
LYNRNTGHIYCASKFILSEANLGPVTERTLTALVVKILMKDKTTKAIPYIWIDFIPALVLPNILLQNGIWASETVCANKKGFSILVKDAKM